MMFFFKRTAMLCALCSLVACSENTIQSNAKAVTASVAESTVTNSNIKTYNIRSISQPYPPFNIFNADRSIGGLEVEVLDAIGRDQNIAFNHVPHFWEDIFNNLKENNISLVGGGLAREDFREYKGLVSSDPYLRSPDCAVALDEETLNNWHKDKVALVSIDDDDQEVINKFGVLPNNIIHTKSQYQSLKLIKNKEVPATMSDCSVLRYYMKSFPDVKFVMKELPMDNSEESAFAYDILLAIREDETELRDKINAGIKNIKESGELDTILKKWL